MRAEDRAKLREGRPFIEVLRHVAADRWSNRPDGREAARRQFVATCTALSYETLRPVLDQAVGIANQLERKPRSAHLVALARDVRAGDASREEVFLDALEEHPVDLERASLRIPEKKTIQATRVVNGAFVGKAPLEYFNTERRMPVQAAAGIVVAISDDVRMPPPVVESSGRGGGMSLQSAVQALDAALTGRTVSFQVATRASANHYLQLFATAAVPRFVPSWGRADVQAALNRITLRVSELEVFGDEGAIVVGQVVNAHGEPLE